jgi:hypothetical protein
LTAVETDPAGNSTAPTANYNVTLDTSAPAAPVIVSVFDDVGPYQGFLQKGDVTDDNQPTVAGTAQAGSVVRLYDSNNALIGSTTADDKGNWSITTVKLADGKHDVFATATNGVGVVSEPTGKWNFVVDTSAPSNVSNLVVTDNVGAVTGPLHNGDTTDDNKPTFSGGAEANGKVIIYDNGSKIGEADVGADGKWSFTPITPLADGDHAFSTEVLDKAGNSSGQGGKLDVVVDTTSVGVTITHVIDDVGSITGDIAKGGVTDDKRPEIQGTSKAGSVVKIYDGSVELGSVTADSKGDWSFTPSGELGEGAHTITAIATDKAGGVSAPATFDFTIDTVAPNRPSIDSVTDDVGAIQGPIANGGITDDSTPTLAGKAEANSIVTVYDNGEKLGSATADADGKWNFTPTTPLAEGKHKFTVDATDKAGNVSEESTPFTITTDYTAPDADKLAITGVEDHVGAVTGNIANGGTTDDSRPVIHGTGTYGDIVTVYAKDSTGNHVIGSATVDISGNWSLKPTLPLVSGLNELTAVETDAAGNATAPTDKYSITLDTSAPQAPVIVSVLDDVGPYQGFLQKGDVTDDSRPTIAGTAPAGSVVRLFDNNDVLRGSATADNKGNWEITPVTALADGKHEIYATSINSVGVVSEPTGKWDFTVDTGAPSNVSNLVVTDNVGALTGPLDFGDTTDDNRPTFSGDAEPNGKVIIYDNGRELGRADVDAQGKWEFEPTAPLSDGEHSFRTEVLDKAGNSSGISDRLDVIVDTSAAEIQITRIVDAVGTITGDIAPNGFTDDTRPEIQGSAKVDSIIQLYDGDDWLGTTRANDDGLWTFIPAWDLDEGEHSIRAIATDRAGNESEPATYKFTVDTVAPIQPSIDGVSDDVGSIQGPIENGGVTDDSTPTLSGGAEAGSIVTIYDNGEKLGSATADADGKWSYTPTTPLSEGDHEFIVEATDKAGNTSEKSEPFNIVTDYTGPNADDTQLSIDIVAGDDVVNLAESQTSQTISGRATGEFTAGDVVSFTLNGTVYSTSVTADGKWSVQVAGTDLAEEASIRATLVAHDAAGNAGNIVAEHGYTVALVPPVATLTISTIVNNDVVNAVKTTAEQTISGKASGEFKAGDVVSFTLNDVDYSTTVDASGNWSVKVPNSALSSDTAYNIHATLVAHDAAGNSSSVVADRGYSITNIWDFDDNTLQGWNSSGSYAQGDNLRVADGHILSYTVGPGMGNVFAGEVMWTEIQVTAGQTYSVSFDKGNLSSTENFAAISMLINGVAVIGQSTATGTRTGTYTATTSGNVRISFNNGTAATSGNDFSLDNITMKPVKVVSAVLAVTEPEMSVIDTAAHTSQHDDVGSERDLSAPVQGGESSSAPIFAAAPGGESLTAAPDAAVVSAPEVVVTVASEPLQATPFALPTVIHQIAALSDSFYGADSGNNYVKLDNAADYLASTSNQGIHGGTGLDVLSVIGYDQVVDLTLASSHGKVTGMEVVDLTGDGQAHNSLKLSLQDVLDNGQTDLFHVTDEHSVQMMVKGDVSDEVTLDHLSSQGDDTGTWSATGKVALGDFSYTVYHHTTAEAELLVQQGVTVHLV